MQQDDAKSTPKRPRARTGTSLPSILRGRKSEPSSAITTGPLSSQPPYTPTSLEGLVEALTPPAVPSPSHARALVRALKTEVPNLDVLTPVIAHICAPGVPSDVLAAGFDVISTCTASRTHPLTELQRISLFSILSSSDPDWALGTCKSRSNCLCMLTEEGNNVAGFEVALLDFTKGCLSFAFERLMSEDENDRVDREIYFKTISRIMRTALNQNAYLYTEQHFRGVLGFFEGLVLQSLDCVPGQMSPEPVSIPSSPVGTPTNVAHRRNASSLGGSVPYPGSRSNHRESLTPLERTNLPIDMYLGFLDVYFTHRFSPHQTSTVAVLLRVVAVHISPLPRLSAWATPHHQPRPIEEAALKQLFAMLSRSSSDMVAAEITSHLASEKWQEALGAFRTVRAVLRHSAESRMALALLRRVPDNFAPTGQLVATERDAGVLDRAHKARLVVPSLTPERLCDVMGTAVHEWSARFHAERVLEEALGITKDIVTEASDRTEGKAGEESPLSIDAPEGRFIGKILSEAVRYIHRMRPLHKIPFLPIDKPSTAPTPLLLALCTLLSLPLSVPMTPSLPSILLSLAPLLTDVQTCSLPGTMYNLQLLTPPSPEWLNNITDLLAALVDPDRPITSLKVLSVVKRVHSSLKALPVYRLQVGNLVCETIERALGGEGYIALEGDASWITLCTNELVWTVMESTQQSGDEGVEEAKQLDGDALAERIIALFVRHAKGPCPCSSIADMDGPSSHPRSREGSIPSVPGYAHPPESPALSQWSSDSVAQEKDQASAQPVVSSSISVLPPIMSILPGWRMPRHREAEVPTSPVASRSDAEAPVVHNCRALLASVALGKAFQSFSFSTPPRAAHSVRLFKHILAVLLKANCPRAKLVMLYLLMRLRADRGHRLYTVGNLDDDIHTLAVLVQRSRLVSRQPPEEIELRRARSTSRGLPKQKPRSSGGSRSRSRPAPATPALPATPVPSAKGMSQDPLWMVPESPPFDIPTCVPSSDGITTYEVNAPSDWEELKHWLPVSDYVYALVETLKSETNWEILSYVLCHLPVQLANKHFFCGPKTKDGIISLLTTLCTVTFKGESEHTLAEHLPESLRLRDAQGLVYHTLTVLISYRKIFDERKHHDILVEAFLAGLSGAQSTDKFCLHALSICAFELPISITKHLSRILEKLSRLITNAAMAVHILDFVSIVGSLPSLYANFREQEFRLVFAVALNYIHHHNSPDTSGLSGRESFALSQHVLVVAYYIIYVWFLAAAVPDRPNHVEFLTRRLALANEAKGAVDEPTQVCFDWLARYTYEATDPKLTSSPLGDIVMNYPREENERIESLPNSKIWLWGNSLVSIRTINEGGRIEVESVRPSGETRFTCQLKDFTQENTGQTEPGTLTVLTPGMSEWDRTETERTKSDLENDATDGATVPHTETTTHRSPGGLVSRVEPETFHGDSHSVALDVPRILSSPLRKLSVDPSFFAAQLSQDPYSSDKAIRSRLVSRSPQLESLLRTLKLTPVIDTHKIAILYVGPGQKTELEILGNSQGTPAYSRFLDGMGRLIPVRDQRDVYTGDLIPETDGEYAYAWRNDIVQVVYHTATLMPNIPTDPIFMYKKRHIGNDKVRIVWNDSGLPYEHDVISSAFNFVNFIIQPHSLETNAAFSTNLHEHEFFKVTMQRMEGMPEFGPIGDYKLVSAENLAPLLRQVSLLADFFSEVYEATEKDTSTHEYVTNWRRRLQYINGFWGRLGSAPDLT